MGDRVDKGDKGHMGDGGYVGDRGDMVWCIVSLYHVRLVIM